MSIGVSTACLYPMPTERALEKLAQCGIKTVEIFFNSHSEIEDGLLDKMADIKNHYNLKIAAIHPFSSAFEPYILFSEYKRRFNDTLEYYKKYFDAAHVLDTEIVILHGGLQKNCIEDDEYIERLGIIIDRGKAEGVIVAHENVNFHKCAAPSFIRKLSRDLGERIHYVFDIKQAVRAGYAPHEVFTAMGDRIVHVHLSDHTKTESCLLPGQGDFHFKEMFDYLYGLGYTGDGVIEVYRTCFDLIDSLIHCVEFLNSELG